MEQPRFQINEVVFNKVDRKGSYGPSTCRTMSRLIIDKVEKVGSTYLYTCDIDGYRFTEDELMSIGDIKDFINGIK